MSNIFFLFYRLGYFEKKNRFFNISQLISQIRRHYEKQATKQFYAVVLGLDVLGNPFGLLRGIVEGGADLFYEPFLVFKSFTQIFELWLVGVICQFVTV